MSQGDTSPIRCFIVEDSPLILQGLTETLEEMLPLRVVSHAATEAEACAWLSDPKHEADLIIVDVFLKQGSGLEVLRHAQKTGHPARRAVLTNYATPEIHRRSLALGADRVFDKSSELDELIVYCQGLADAAELPPPNS